MTSSTMAATRRSAPAPEAEQVPRVPWSIVGPDFIRAWGRPRGQTMPEHVEILGPTGSGKTYFGRQILLERAKARRSHIVIIATKPADETLMSMGWPIITKWPPDYGKDQVIFWAKAPGIDEAGTDRQREAIVKLLGQLWKKDSNIIVVFDEVAYLCINLKMNPQVSKYYREGRGLGITVVSFTQRAPGITRYVHSESAWTVCFKPKDEEDAERVAQVLGSKKVYVPILMSLNQEKYEFLLVHNLTGDKVISWIDRAARIPAKNNSRK